MPTVRGVDGKLVFIPKGVENGTGQGNMATGQVKRPMEENGAFAKKAKGGGAAHGAQGTLVGEVRFEAAHSAQTALQLAGSNLGGSPIGVSIDERSKDMTKIMVTDIAAGVEWQELKDHFSPCGLVIFADVKSGAARSAEIRMQSPEEAQQAIAMLNGFDVGGGVITVKPHPASKDGSKLQVLGVPHHVAWQDLKDFFAQTGTVVFADIKDENLPPGATLEGEVRYDDPAHMQQALTSLNGSFIGDTQIFLQTDSKSSDGSKLIVNGLTPNIEWQELKDHFASIGRVAFANVYTKGFGKGMPKGFPSMKGCGGFGKAVFGGKGGKFGGKSFAEGMIRFDTSEQAQMAIAMLNGSTFNGGLLQVDWDWKSFDGTKLCVAGIPLGSSWQDLKDHFACCGRVMFADIKGGKGKGGK